MIRIKWLVNRSKLPIINCNRNLKSQPRHEEHPELRPPACPLSASRGPRRARGCTKRQDIRCGEGFPKCLFDDWTDGRGWKKQFIYCVLIFVSGGGGDYAHGIWDPGRVLMWGLSSCTNWFQHQKVVKTLNPTLVSHRTIKIKIGFWNTRHHHMQIQVFLQTSFLLKILFTTNKFWFEERC